MPPISLLIKPASGSCNMACEYCFYSDVTSSRLVANYGMMTAETLEVIMQKVFAIAEGTASFGFQGGEPTLAGLDFFKTVVALQKRYNTKYVKVNNALQTNGLNINAEWATFLKQNKFLVGLSLDGTKAVHDKYRLDMQKNGTFERVLATAKLMERHGVEYNILTTVTIDVAQNIDKIYYFFKKNGFNYLQFIPCLDDLNSENKQEYSLTPEAYGEFLIKLFRLWYVDANSNKPISIRYFDNLAMMLYGYPPESCGMSGCCTCYYMIEADGSVYPCDFYVTDRWRIGSVLKDDLQEMVQTKTAKEFAELSRQIAPECKSCEHFAICRGGCRRNREPIENNSINELCTAFKMFFDYAKADLLKIATRFLS